MASCRHHHQRQYCDWLEGNSYQLSSTSRKSHQQSFTC